MKKRPMTLPEVGFIAATRAMAGIGIGLLVSDQLGRRNRRTLGWTLLAIGAVTTIPVVMLLIARGNEEENAF